MEKHIADPDQPLLLEGATGLGKTYPYLRAAAKSGKRVAIVFPTHQLIDQALASWDLKTVLAEFSVQVKDFRPRRFFEDNPGHYNLQKDEAIASDILLCTSISVIIDQRLAGAYNGVITRDVIIFDEADQLPQFAALSSETSVRREDLKALNINEATAANTIKAIFAKKRVAPEITAKARIIEEALQQGDVWYRKVAFADDGSVELRSRLPGRLLRRISNLPSTIFISATLSINDTFNDFKRSMGIDNQSRFSSIIEPTKHGKLHFDFSIKEELGSAPWLRNICHEIEIAEHPTLVVTPSHSLAEQLGEALSEVTIRGRNETTSEAAARMGNTKTLVAAGAWAGLDTPIEWKTIIVPRIPYTGPKNLRDVWDEDEEDFLSQAPDNLSSYIDSANAAARRLKQVFGRGLRKPEAECWVLICDSRIDRFQKVAPKRFEKAYFEGRAFSTFVSKSERSRAIRKDALAHYGEQCMTCSFTHVTLRQLEIHHLNPLADNGPTHTRLEDVAVLCRNCHGLAHSENPPLTLETIIELNKRPKRGSIVFD